MKYEFVDLEKTDRYRPNTQNDPTYGGVFYLSKIILETLGIVEKISYVYTVMRNEPLMNEPLLNELQAFPSVQIGYTEGGWVYFQASDSVIGEISQQLKRRVQRIVRNEYRLSLI